ncbi:hypothetical protein [Streptomyces sclerotialus]|uniref:hypothetical protein n=1 Tax=Streptomyces sclerotialus TaxID=1957 RepID=UPI0004C834A1
MSAPERLRLLPWAGADGQPCYLAGAADRSGYVARLADEMEAVQLRVGMRLTERAEELLGEPGSAVRPEVRPGEVRALAYALREALRDALRIAESRGGRGAP